ncbi:aminopeptidase P family protein [Myxococcota bacterium]|nr:aminopeptidase P family protein [Myxococcota bacterium]MBU1379988.1 aminopeptidase P family protein [Myxococcota bacterium]MBU1498346.1 aminopeptidase P family protein [Myxococcota bacterium]
MNRLVELRKIMAGNGFDAWLVPSTDPHQSEYLPDYWKRRAFLTGFSGSAGDAVILMDKAGLWTDSRYFIQAETELEGTGIELHRLMTPGVISISDYLLANLKPGSVVGFDSEIMLEDACSELGATLLKGGISLKPSRENIIDSIWEGRPDFPDSTIFPLGIEFTGESAEARLTKIRGFIAQNNASAMIFAGLDEIAWITNLRGSDIDYNPFFISYLIVTPDNAFLYTGINKVSEETWKTVGNLVEFQPYYQFYEDLESLFEKNAKVLMDRNFLTVRISGHLKNNARAIAVDSPVPLWRSLKNETELEGMRKSHVRDGVALVRFFKWLYESLENGVRITEYEASNKIDEFRSQMPLSHGPSFETISAFGPHGAIVHYTSTPETDVDIKKDGIFLLDSGGQYSDGTTDITRTVVIGTPTSHEKTMFTAVLAGHIDLARAVFPEGTSGKQLDTLARKPLWDMGLNYGHGTGHGVGMFSGVHEGPQAISFYRCRGVAMQKGMITTNEPGYYEPGKFGIRIENVYETVVNRPADEKASAFLGFKNLTWFPIDNKLIDYSLLSEVQADWVKQYNRQCVEILKDHLSEDELKWLENYIVNVL